MRRAGGAETMGIRVFNDEEFSFHNPMAKIGALSSFPHRQPGNRAKA